MAALTFRIEEDPADKFRVVMTHDTVDTFVSDPYASAADAATAFAYTLYAVAQWDLTLWDEGEWKQDDPASAWGE
jgi:hypothetical protein